MSSFDSELERREELSSSMDDEAYSEITVTDPAKQGEGVNSYISYKITSKANRSGSVATFNVIRRFSDFVFLHNRIAVKNKGFIIPPLPEKNVVEKFRFSAEFIEIRRLALEMFLIRLNSHPHLHKNFHLKLFLEADEDEWSVEMLKSSESSLFKSKGTDFLQIFKGMHNTISHAVYGKEKIEEVDEERDEIKEYITNVENILFESQKLAKRLIKRHKAMSICMHKFGESFVLLSQSEDMDLNTQFLDVGNLAKNLSEKYQEQASKFLVCFEQPLKEYFRMMNEIKSVLNERQSALKNQVNLKEELESKKNKLEKFQCMDPKPKEEKIKDLEIDISNMNMKVENAKNEYELIVERMKIEMQRFQEMKMNDFAKIFRDFAKFQQLFCQEMQRAWKALL